MLLLITNSEDATSDLLVDRLHKKIFRLNYDIFSDYTFDLSLDRWEIRSPSGHFINSENVRSVFWWKAFSSSINHEDPFIIEEMKYILREIYHWGRLRGITNGNPHDFHNSLGKFNLLKIASKYFMVPKTLITKGLSEIPIFDEMQTVVVKSLSSGQTASKKTLLSTKVEKKLLSPKYPWYLQEEIVSESDITIFICGRQRFFYAKNRNNLIGIDWRGEQSPDVFKKEWIRFQPSSSFESAVSEFCSEIKVNWGRLDLMGSDSTQIFLEFNANGQWIFLDYSNEDKLVDHVVDYIYPSEVLPD